MTPEDRAARIASLQEKLAARRGQKGFEQNAKDIDAEIARLRGEDAPN